MHLFLVTDRFIEGEGDEVTSPKISGMVNSALTTVRKMLSNLYLINCSVHPFLVECVLLLQVLHHSLNLWEFDTFALREITGDNPLLCICWTLCKVSIPLMSDTSGKSMDE